MSLWGRGRARKVRLHRRAGPECERWEVEEGKRKQCLTYQAPSLGFRVRGWGWSTHRTWSEEDKQTMSTELSSRRRPGAGPHRSPLCPHPCLHRASTVTTAVLNKVLFLFTVYFFFPVPPLFSPGSVLLFPHSPLNTLGNTPLATLRLQLVPESSWLGPGNSHLGAYLESVCPKTVMCI